MQEKRVHQRKLMRVDAMLSDADGAARRPVVMLDVSQVGVSFIHASALDSGARLFLDFSLPGSELVEETVIQVVHSTAAGVAAGVRVGARFVHVAPETREGIARFIAGS